MSKSVRRKPSHGAVAVLVEDEKFLVIRRSRLVRAPNMLCFAGGTIEIGEQPEETIVRELKEELSLDATAVRHVFQNRTSWGTLLEWVLVERHENSQPIANPAEVSEWMWLTASELLDRHDLLPSVPDFFWAWATGQLEMPERAGTPESKWKFIKPNGRLVN
ncbi:NUDIX hydrolase [Aureliella helgolandensis]|uniref:8-oxo-dGTP diphosphatase n=1 Tax=Aureliella helgolandensis TaxID=2527968 RepID=A0A518GC61_9BACT|nr:NUDIX domain-containing protein [Aureliella helgolandensis]QDV26184.1 8-oxo-dGTP diphosphatase [Aureliella helgolandensis]